LQLSGHEFPSRLQHVRRGWFRCTFHWLSFDNLIQALRVFCEGERGRQSKVAHILGLQSSVLVDWFARRKMTGEQALAAQDFLRTVYGPEATQAPPSQPEPEDPIEKLHNSLDNPDTKTIWVRPVGDFYHIIVGGSHHAFNPSSFASLCSRTSFIMREIIERSTRNRLATCP
jgi:hypothetical protein